MEVFESEDQANQLIWLGVTVVASYKSSLLGFKLGHKFESLQVIKIKQITYRTTKK